VTGFACETGTVDRPRLAAHLAESRQLLTAPLEQMDMCLFRIGADEVRIVSPLTQACDALTAAAGKPWELRAEVPRGHSQAGFCDLGRLRRALFRMGPGSSP
jgi:hypothetical protein